MLSCFLFRVDIEERFGISTGIFACQYCRFYWLNLLRITKSDSEIKPTGCLNDYYNSMRWNISQIKLCLILHGRTGIETRLFSCVIIYPLVHRNPLIRCWAFLFSLKLKYTNSIIIIQFKTWLKISIHFVISWLFYWTVKETVSDWV